MKNLLLATSALVVVAGAQPARAADQTGTLHLPTKAQIVPPAPIYNWTGCYIGVHGGGGDVSDTFVAGGGLNNLNFLHGGNGFAGAQIGCNYQNGVMVWGLEGEAWSGLTNSEHFSQPGFSVDAFTRNRWSADAAVRAGLAFDRALVYSKAGVAEGRFGFGFSFAQNTGFFGNGASALTGVLLGVGLEYGFAPNWSAKLEYDHIEYAGRTVHFEQSAAQGGPFDQTQSVSENLVKAGINYRFGGPSLPLASDSTTSHPSIYKALPAKTLPPTPFSWTGCYAGVHGGGGWMLDLNVSEGSGRSGGGGFAGGQLGCNVQAGAIVWGVEGEVAWSGLTDHFHSSSDASFLDATTRNRWSADVAVRAGVAVDRALIYGKAGLAAGRFGFFFDISGQPPEAANASATLTGLLLGGGIEYAFAPNWSVKLEYDHVNYFGQNVAFADTLEPFVQSEAATTNVVKLGVNYRFGGGPFSGLPLAPAADRAASGPAIFKVPVYKASAAAIANWTGCYVGIHGGGGVFGDTFANSVISDVGGNDFLPVPLSSGGFAGGQLGCDYQTGPIVWGLSSLAIAGAPTSRCAPASPSTARSSTARPASRRAASPSLRQTSSVPSQAAPRH